MIRSVCVALLLFGRAAAAETTVGVGTEYMEWREYHPMPLLQESGFRPFAELEGYTGLSSDADLSLVARIYGGDVDYNGQLMDGTPLRASTGYAGLSGEAGARWFLPGMVEDRLFLLVRAGVDAWTRDLKGRSGYREEYRLFYLRAGFQDEAPVGRWSARGGLLFPLSARERVNLAGGFELQPQGRPSPWFEFGRRFGKGREVGVAFRRYRFDASDPVSVDIDGDGFREQVFQPHSESDTYGIYARFGF